MFNMRKIPFLFCAVSLIASLGMGCEEESRNDCIAFADKAFMHYAFNRDYSDYGHGQRNWDKNDDACISPDEAAMVKEFRGNYSNGPYCGLLNSVDDINQFPNLTVIGDWALMVQTHLQSISLDHIETVGNGAFNGSSSIQTVDLPNAKTIGSEAFVGCTLLNRVSLPKLESLGESAFAGCSMLRTIEFPGDALTVVEDYTFYETPIESIDLPNVVSVGTSAFSLTDLKTIELPKAERIGEAAFETCSGMSSAILPKATEIGDRAFYQCYFLSSVEVPEATIIGEMAFLSTNIANLSLPHATSIGARVFPKNLRRLELTTEDRITLDGDAFEGLATDKVDLVLHSNKSLSREGYPLVEGDTLWAGREWKSISFVN